MPAGQEDRSVAFYQGLLGIPQVPKPDHLAVRGGCWFEQGPLRVHLGVDDDFRPARKAHAALVVSSLDEIVGRMRDAGVPVRDEERLNGAARVFVEDPFGNRIELIEAP